MVKGHAKAYHGWTWVLVSLALLRMCQHVQKAMRSVVRTGTGPYRTRWTSQANITERFTCNTTAPVAFYAPSLFHKPSWMVSWDKLILKSLGFVPWRSCVWVIKILWDFSCLWQVWVWRAPHVACVSSPYLCTRFHNCVWSTFYLIPTFRSISLEAKRDWKFSLMLFWCSLEGSAFLAWLQFFVFVEHKKNDWPLISLN